MRKLIMEDQPIPIITGVVGLIVNLIYFFNANSFLKNYGIKNFNNFTEVVPKIIQNNDVERLALLAGVGSVLIIGLLVVTWYCAIRPVIDAVFENNVLWWFTISIYILNVVMTIALIRAVLLLWGILVICEVYSAANSNSAS